MYISGKESDLREETVICQSKKCGKSFTYNKILYHLKGQCKSAYTDDELEDLRNKCDIKKKERQAQAKREKYSPKKRHEKHESEYSPSKNKEKYSPKKRH